MTEHSDIEKTRALEGVEWVHDLPTPPPRPADAHKGTFGSVLLVAGSTGLSGAASLAGRGALHGGAGLVTVAIPQSIAFIVAVAHSSYMTIPLEDDDKGRVKVEAIPRLERALESQSCIGLGPGLGQSSDVAKVVQHLNRHCEKPMVIDADGLNAFAGKANLLRIREADAPRILTPHPGEFSRLTGIDLTTVQSDRAVHAVEFAKTNAVVIVLKGRHTIVTNGVQVAINSTGSTALATGGTGDVLTGLIASLVAQGMTDFEAARLGVHLHGLAGEAAGDRFTDRYATSVDLADHLGAAWKQFLDS